MTFDLLAKASTDLLTLCQDIEDGLEIDESLSCLFKDLSDNLSTEIDRRKAFLAEIEIKKAQAKEHQYQIDLYLKRLDKIALGLKEQTKSLILHNPALPWRDSLGKKLSVCKAPPKLHIEDKEQALLCGYSYKVEEFKIDREAIKTALLAGQELAWARLDYHTYVRGL